MIWIRRRYYRLVLGLFWVLFRISGRQTIIRWARYVPEIYKQVTETLVEEIEDLVTGFWLYNYNPCWHRALISVMWNRKHDITSVAAIGVALGLQKWDLHIWIENQNGVNCSDFSLSENMHVLNSFKI